MTTALLPRKVLHITAMALPLAGWTLHTTLLHRRLTAAHRDPLTGTWRREAFAPTRLHLSLQDEAIDPGVPGLEAESLIQAIRCLPRRTRRQVNGSSTRRLREAQSLLGQSPPNAMSSRGPVHDNVLDACSQTGRQGEHDQRQHPDHFAFDPRHQHRICIAGEQALHCLAIQRAGCARKLRQQARECLNRLVICFTDDHNLNAHDLDLTEQAPSRGGTSETDPRVVRENHFKRLNDTRGHAAGDTALAAIGARLTEWSGPRGVAGRLGGDEFAALARIEPRHQQLRLAHLARLVSRPVPYEGGLLPLAVSLGAATPAAVTSTGLPALMRAADAAMYEGKHTGGVVQARPDHARVPSVNGRRLGRPGTAVRGRAA